MDLMMDDGLGHEIFFCMGHEIFLGRGMIDGEMMIIDVVWLFWCLLWYED